MFSSGEFHGQRRLAGYSPQGRRVHWTQLKRLRMHARRQGWYLEQEKDTSPTMNTEGCASSQDGPVSSGSPDTSLGPSLERSTLGDLQSPIIFPEHKSRIRSAPVGTLEWRGALFNYLNSILII